MQTIVLNSSQTSESRARLRLTLFAITTLLCSVSACSRAGSAPPAATKVTVIGEASLKAQPDTAVIVLSVVTQNPQALNAQQENAGKINAVTQAVQESAGAKVEIKTNAYSLQPQQDYSDKKLPRIVGYEVRNSVTVTTPDLNKVGVIIDAASRAGANSVEGVSFILRDNSATAGQVLAEATSQAMTKARSIATAMGGRVVRVAEEQEQATTGLQPVMNTYSLDSLSREREQTLVSAGPISVNSRVQLIVEVDARPLPQ